MNNLKEIFLNLKFKIKEVNKNFGRVIWISFSIILMLFLVFIYYKNNQSKNLEVIFLNVGQGDSILIKTPEKKNVLIDAGPSEIILKRLSENLSIFNKDINIAVLTHPDADHAAGFVPVFQKYNIKTILENGDTKENPIYDEVKNKIEAEKSLLKSEQIFANCGDKISIGELEMYILNPVKNEFSEKDGNDNSIVILLVYGDYNILLNGDAGVEVEKRISFNVERCFTNIDKEILKEKLKNITVYKASHHGSDTGNSEEFIKKIKPKYIVVSAGKNNRYGHPMTSVMNIFEKYSKNILNTMSDGNIIFKTNGKDFQVETEK